MSKMSFGDQMLKLFYIGPLFNRPSAVHPGLLAYMFIKKSLILTFMATLLCKDQVKFSELNSDFSNKIFVSCLKLLKTYSPSVFFKVELKLYVFESQKFKSKFQFENKF